MAEEVKQEEKKAESKQVFSTLIKIILGVALLLLGLALTIRWRVDLAVVFRGCIGLFLVLVGVITLAIAKE
ncbi:MAG: hypothetical protein AB1481_07125 [Candidatus Omnitrophota bacterium]